jgi:hypothetical protein
MQPPMPPTTAAIVLLAAALSSAAATLLARWAPSPRWRPASAARMATPVAGRCSASPPPPGVLFVLVGNEGRAGPVNGYTIRDAVGASGTDQSVVLVAEQLARRGWRAVVASPNSGACAAGAAVNGVVYTDLQLTGVHEREFAVLVNSLWVGDPARLPATITRAVVSWCHCPYVYARRELRAYLAAAARGGGCGRLRYGVVYPSEWTRRRCARAAREVSTDAAEAVIPNPLMADVIDEVRAERLPREPRRLVFHADWARGGDVAAAALGGTGWPDGRLVSCSYNRQLPPGRRIEARGALGKRDVLREVARSEYFVYPLVNGERGIGQQHHGQVHKDTFACVVAEACALGAVVLTYPVAGLPDTYGDAVHWLDFPPGVRDARALAEARWSSEPALLRYDHISDALLRLEADPALCARLRARGRALADERFGPEAVGARWHEFLRALLAPEPAPAAAPPAP